MEAGLRFAAQISPDETFGNERSKTSKSDHDLFDSFDLLKRLGLLGAFLQLFAGLARVLTQDKYRCSAMGARRYDTYSGNAKVFKRPRFGGLNFGRKSVLSRRNLGIPLSETDRVIVDAVETPD